MYVWECYAIKKFHNYHEYDIAMAPYSYAYAIGADGISIIEQSNATPNLGFLSTCRAYEDFTALEQMRYQHVNIFAENQWSLAVKSFGPDGVAAPIVNNSNDYISTLDRNGIGVLFFDNIAYIAAFWYFHHTGEWDNQAIAIEMFCRPRKIKPKAIWQRLLSGQCCKVCPNPEYEWATLDLNDCKECQLITLSKNCKDDPEKEITLPGGKDGKKIKCKDIAKRPVYEQDKPKPKPNPVAELHDRLDDILATDAVTWGLDPGYENSLNVQRELQTFHDKFKTVHNANKDKDICTYMNAMDTMLSAERDRLEGSQYLENMCFILDECYVVLYQYRKAQKQTKTDLRAIHPVGGIDLAYTKFNKLMSSVNYACSDNLTKPFSQVKTAEASASPEPAPEPAAQPPGPSEEPMTQE